MFEDVRRARPEETVPNVASVSSLPAYNGETEESFLYLPFVDLECVNARVWNDTSGTVAGNLTYEDFTSAFFDTYPEVSSLSIPPCIKNDTFCG